MNFGHSECQPHPKKIYLNLKKQTISQLAKPSNKEQNVAKISYEPKITKPKVNIQRKF